MEIRKSKLITALQFVLSIVALIVIVILFFYAKNRVKDRLNIWQVKIPHNETELRQVSDAIISDVVRSATDGGIKNILGRSETFFEESELAGPARSIRDDAQKAIDSLLARIKSLPAEEYRVIKQKIYETWFKTEN